MILPLILFTAVMAAEDQWLVGAWAAGQPRSSDAVRARHEVCYMLAAGSAYPPFNLADCLSFGNAPEAVFKTQVCNFLHESEQLQDYNFASHSDCLRQRLIR